MGSSSSDSRTIELTAGKPFSQKIRVVGAKTIWASINDLEVRAEMRTGPVTKDDLISELHNFMTWVYEDNDLVISWIMTGKQTRELYSLKWASFKMGYFNLIVSDVGTVDSRALVVPLITIKGIDTTTKEGAPVVNNV